MLGCSARQCFNRYWQKGKVLTASPSFKLSIHKDGIWIGNCLFWLRVEATWSHFLNTYNGEMIKLWLMVLFTGSSSPCRKRTEISWTAGHNLHIVLTLLMLEQHTLHSHFMSKSLEHCNYYQCAQLVIIQISCSIVIVYIWKYAFVLIFQVQKLVHVQALYCTWMKSNNCHRYTWPIN